MGIEAAALAVGGYSAYSNYQMQEDQAKATEDYNRQVLSNMVDNYHLLASTEVDTLESSYSDSLDAQVRYLDAKAKAQNNAAAIGAAGGSVDMIMGEIERQGDVNMAEIISNRERAFSQINHQAESIRRGSHNQMKSIKKPSVKAALIKGATDGIKTYFIADSLSEGFAEYGGMEQLSTDVSDLRTKLGISYG